MLGTVEKRLRHYDNQVTAACGHEFRKLDVLEGHASKQIAMPREKLWGKRD